MISDRTLFNLLLPRLNFETISVQDREEASNFITHWIQTKDTYRRVLSTELSKKYVDRNIEMICSDWQHEGRYERQYKKIDAAFKDAMQQLVHQSGAYLFKPAPIPTHVTFELLQNTVEEIHTKKAKILIHFFEKFSKIYPSAKEHLNKICACGDPSSGISYYWLQAKSIRKWMKKHKKMHLTTLPLISAYPKEVCLLKNANAKTLKIIFQIAAENGHLETVWAIIQDPRFEPNMLPEALSDAAKKGHLACLKLLATTAKKRCWNNSLCNALKKAIKTNQIPSATLLLDYLNNSSSLQPILFDTVKYEETSFTRLLLKKAAHHFSDDDLKCALVSAKPECKELLKHELRKRFYMKCFQTIVSIVIASLIAYSAFILTISNKSKLKSLKIQKIFNRME